MCEPISSATPGTYSTAGKSTNYQLTGNSTIRLGGPNVLAVS